jgi:N-methylhydantoinase A
VPSRRRGRRRVPILVGVDTGGTFTDLVAVVGGALRWLKVASTPRDPSAAVAAGIATLASGAPVRLHYGSTVATNALLERRGARVMLITTEGFEDVVEIGRQVRPRLYALEPERPRPLVPRAGRVGVRERVLADGRVETPLAAAAVRRAVGAVRRGRAEAVAVCLLHSYATPAHELRIGRALRGRGLHVTLSHRLLREYREYERVVTAVTNAYVGPVMARHLDALASRVGGRVRVMQSSGGLIGAPAAGAEAVRTLLSGPAAGVVGAAVRARRAGLPRIITLDMGGTSADVSLVDGKIAFRGETTIAGLPVRIPAIDIHTVGAGGGSLARLDPAGALRVGPESAGADPGPACFGRGTAPTVTDANLVLGRLVEDEFLGGSFRLDRSRAERALGPLARALGGSIEAAAAGIVAVANAAMERAIRVITVERGHDPRDFTLLAFGGAGALHAAELAEALGIRRVYVPRQPGLLSAWGVLGAEVIRDHVRTMRVLAPATAAVQAGLRALARIATADLRREGVRRPVIERWVEARYAGQSYEVAVVFRPGWVREFHRQHARLYGHADERRPVEVVTLRVRARGGAIRVPSDPQRSSGRATPRALRAVFFGGRRHRTAIHRRDDLRSGRRLRGPAVVCEYSATTLVPPGWRCRVDRTGGLVVET